MNPPPLGAFCSLWKYHLIYECYNILPGLLVLSQDKVLARIETVGDMFVFKNIPHLITNDLCPVYLSIDVGV